MVRRGVLINFHESKGGMGLDEFFKKSKGGSLDKILKKSKGGALINLKKKKYRVLFLWKTLT